MSDSVMSTNYIYLLQEREFIKTNEQIYKIGRTTKENHTRFNQYPKGSVLLFQMICNNCVNAEVNIIGQFKERLKQRKDIGTEYFEGDFNIMIEIIYYTIKIENCLTKKIDDIIEENIKIDNNIKNDDETIDNTIEECNDDDKNSENDDDDDNNDDDNNDDDDDDSEHEEIKLKFESSCKTISEIFPDYRNDETFGGNKKYIKLDKINDEYIVYYICPYFLKHYPDDIDDDFLTEHEIRDNNTIDLQYFHDLINKKTVLAGEIYDTNCIKFINKINKTKLNITMENYNEFIPCRDKYKMIDMEEKIRNFFYCNMIINFELYCTMKLDISEDYNILQTDIGEKRYIPVSIYKINKKYYDYETYLRKYIPYVIRPNIDNNYYLLNRDYEYIGLNTYTMPEPENKIKNPQESYWLFNDGTTPWSGKKYSKRFINEYQKVTKSLNICLNPNTFTENILCSLAGRSP